MVQSKAVDRETAEYRYHVIISERVAQTLVFHVAFLAQARLDVAKRLTKEFKKAANSLKTIP